MMTPLRSFALVLALATSALVASGGCTGAIDPVSPGVDAAGHPDEDRPPAPGPAIALHAVSWQPVTGDIEGQIKAVTELGGDVVIFTDRGVYDVVSQSLVGADTSMTGWLGAATIPAADAGGCSTCPSTSQWVVGLDSAGTLWRFHDLTSFENISSRYGLTGTPVQSITPLGPRLVAFATAAGVAVADGATVTTYPGLTGSLSGGGGRLVAASPDTVRVLDPSTHQVTSFPLPGLTAAVVDAAGRVVATTATTLYREISGSLQPLYTAPSGQLHGLALSGARLWFAADTTLAIIEDNVIRQSAPGAVAASAQLLGSSSGDVWALAQGTLTRLALDASSADEQQWQQTVAPIFARVCAQCHVASGSSGIDLSTYTSWADRRAVIEQRVVMRKAPMPPAGAEVDTTPAEREAIAAWLHLTPSP